VPNSSDSIHVFLDNSPVPYGDVLALALVKPIPHIQFVQAVGCSPIRPPWQLQVILPNPWDKVDSKSYEYIAYFRMQGLPPSEEYMLVREILPSSSYTKILDHYLHNFILRGDCFTRKQDSSVSAAIYKHKPYLEVAFRFWASFPAPTPNSRSVGVRAGESPSSSLDSVSESLSNALIRNGPLFLPKSAVTDNSRHDILQISSTLEHFLSLQIQPLIATQTYTPIKIQHSPQLRSISTPKQTDHTKQ
jgi:hypothetical protein